MLLPLAGLFYRREVANRPEVRYAALFAEPRSRPGPVVVWVESRNTAGCISAGKDAQVYRSREHASDVQSVVPERRTEPDF